MPYDRELTNDQITYMHEIAEQQRATWRDKTRKELLREIASDERMIKKKQEKLDYLRGKNRAIIDFVEWGEDAPEMERPNGSHFRALRKAVADGNTTYLWNSTIDTPARDLEKEVFRFTEAFVVEHNWAAAFDSATDDVKDAIVRLPYEVCAFEFKFSGCPVIALATEFGTEIIFTPAILHGGIWYLFDYAASLHGFDPLDERNTGTQIVMDAIAKQIRAVCIALDAEVAKTDEVKTPYTGQPGRGAVRPPKPYHVVSLANRSPRSTAASTSETGRRIRMHFRRGHWRHLEESRIWIKWTLVGDPELGFIEKHYKL